MFYTIIHEAFTQGFTPHLAAIHLAGLRHCEMWKPGRTDNNCDTNTDVVAAFLAEKQVESSAYLYMATDWANVDRNRLTKVLHSLDNSKYKVGW